jgi:hypothetical protein
LATSKGNNFKLIEWDGYLNKVISISKKIKESGYKY